MKYRSAGPIDGRRIIVDPIQIPCTPPLSNLIKSEFKMSHTYVRS